MPPTHAAQVHILWWLRISFPSLFSTCLGKVSCLESPFQDAALSALLVVSLEVLGQSERNPTASTMSKLSKLQGSWTLRHLEGVCLQKKGRRQLGQPHARPVSCSVAASSDLTYSASPWPPHTARLFSRRPQRLCQLIPGEVQAVGKETDSAGTLPPGLMSLSTPVCILRLHLPSCKVDMIQSPVTNKAAGLASS